MKFEEWFKVEYPNQHVFKESTLTCKSFYNGASVVWDYKQAEIDAALKQRDSFIKAHHIAMNDVCDQKAEIDALQNKYDNMFKAFNLVNKHRGELGKRIDDALNELCRLQYASAERVYHDVSKILKGDKDD